MRSKKGQYLFIWLIVFTIITLLTLVLRIWAIRVQVRKLRADDYLILLAVVSLLALEGPTWWAIENGLGAHTDQVNASQAAVQKKLLYSAGVTWTLGTVSCKLAMLCIYKKIFPTTKLKVSVYILMLLTVCEAVIFIPIFLTQCLPPSAAWNPDAAVQLKHCRPITHQEFASVSFNMLLDLAVVLLPLPTVWSLQLPTRKKVIVSAMLSLGLAIVGVMGWRISTTVLLTKDPGWVYLNYRVAFQSHLEIWFGIIAANLPSLSPLNKRYLQPALNSYFNPRDTHFGQPAGGTISLSRSFGRVRYTSDHLIAASVDLPVELIESQHLNKIEAGVQVHSENPSVITVRRGVDVSVDGDSRQMHVDDSV